MVSQSDWFGSWPLLVPKKVKMDPKMDPKSDMFGPQNANNSTCSQSSSKRNLYYNSPDILIYLTPNKLHFRCFGVLAFIKSGLRFYVNLETDQKASWRPQEAEQVPTETFFGRFGAPIRNQEGPKSDPKLVQNAKKTSANIDGIVVFIFLLLLRAQEANLVDLGSIWGRFGVDLGVDLGVYLRCDFVLSWVDFESICLFVCLSLSAI